MKLVAVYLLLLLYIALAYGNPPAVVVRLLSSTPAKFVAFGVAVVLAVVLDPFVGVLAAVAVAVSLPGGEFFTTARGDTTARPPGRNVPARRAPHTDTESRLQRPALYAAKGKPRRPRPLSTAASGGSK